MYIIGLNLSFSRNEMACVTGASFHGGQRCSRQLLIVFKIKFSFRLTQNVTSGKEL